MCTYQYTSLLQTNAGRSPAASTRAVLHAGRAEGCSGKGTDPANGILPASSSSAPGGIKQHGGAHLWIPALADVLCCVREHESHLQCYFLLFLGKIPLLRDVPMDHAFVHALGSDQSWCTTAASCAYPPAIHLHLYLWICIFLFWLVVPAPCLQGRELARCSTCTQLCSAQR